MKNLKPIPYFLLIIVLCLGVSCKNQKKENTTEKSKSMVAENLTIVKSEFGKTKEGAAIEKYTLKNKNGVELNVITYGGRITSLKIPNKNGKLENVVLGHDTMEGYLRADNPFFGALIGRYGNRIANGKFTL